MATAVDEKIAIYGDRRPINTTLALDPEAYWYLRSMCPGNRGHGRFLSQLLLLDKQRREADYALRQARKG